MSGAQRTALFSLVAAVGLTVVKLIAGLATHSLGLLADSAHSGVDVVASLLTLLAVGVSVRAPDLDHPYGHGKAEHLGALAEAALLILVSIWIAVEAVLRLTDESATVPEAPVYAILVILGVMAVDASRAAVSLAASRRYRSAALRANALHFLSDLLTSAAVLIGLMLVRAGLHDADAITALVVAVLVLAAAARLIRHNVDVLMDRAPAHAIEAARSAAAEVEGVAFVQRARVREAGGRYLADVDIRVSRRIGLERGHSVADEVEAAVAERLGGADVVVHVEPGDHERETVQERVEAAAMRLPDLRELHNVAVRREQGGWSVSLHAMVEPDMALDRGRELAGRLEDELRTEVPDLASVEVHLEPLIAPSAAADLTRKREEVTASIHAAVRGVSQGIPHSVRLLGTDGGLLATVHLDLPGHYSVDEAHKLASAVEREIWRREPSLREVVVHFGAKRPEDP